jgi:hypothetical protein
MFFFLSNKQCFEIKNRWQKTGVEAIFNLDHQIARYKYIIAYMNNDHKTTKLVTVNYLINKQTVANSLG